MISFPYAKINLGLNVIERRTDGYHNLETVFYPVKELTDVLEFVPAEQTMLQLLGLPVQGDIEQNLVIRALRLLQADYAIPELAVCLKKKIPMGAGLGGGSSDAAFMLTMINDYFKLGLSETELIIYATRLGADCTFFLRERVAFASNIGDKLTDLPLSLQGYYLALITPNIHISTAEAYRNIKPKPWQKSLQDIIKQPIELWKEFLLNDFEPTVFARHPQLATIKTELYQAGALYAAMSGSGSSLFGIFKDLNAIKSSKYLDQALVLKL